MKSIKRKGYKAISAGAVTLETVGKPGMKSLHNLALEGSHQIYDSIDMALDEIERGSYRKLSWFTRSVKVISHGIRKLTDVGLGASYRSQMEDFNMIEQGMTLYQKDLEEYFESQGIDV